MPPRIPLPIRRSPLSSASASLIRSPNTLPRPAIRSLASTSHSHDDHHDHHHEEPYDEPSGWFLGVPPGEARQNEGWEKIMWYGFFGSLAAFSVALAYKPDTSIQTWALEEARRRLEKEGILPPPSGQTANSMYTIQNAILKSRGDIPLAYDEKTLSNEELDAKIVEQLKFAIVALEKEEDSGDADLERRKKWALAEAKKVVERGGIYGTSTRQ
ncbi:hypothetical protein TWF569_011846 [Orbilia oligospora]|uniref:NADH dehydrogenase [ubiquinone] 1 beta subcomplex subunit 11, mitochondrial n=1 Tax=Orbilia oligospora TaxID=2813651 RepID=A0A4Z0XNB5_ORBOL|nr:hypothetical protein TWF706_002687 [Orbilia oligospora]KAF3084166.1 hypothetical protein TWF103_002608 [Orbilia oligospora]KAF3099511.1 hypothetical protein TWF102_005484 [Orbilia oligospora]KAF3125756.1 hypothetical protein TWF594_001319 [Orbilia oligospora]KAF3127231.1 hypothetical protein TWF569_011846 [Orbilia oligospora]